MTFFENEVSKKQGIDRIHIKNQYNDFYSLQVYHLKRVSHANIVQFHGASTRKPNICLIMEYAEEGSLNGVLYGEPKIAYKASHALNWARQCAEGVAYLHAMQPKPNIHRDLKPGNLLLFDQGRLVKICDFGTSRVMTSTMTNNIGSVIYMAPGKRITKYMINFFQNRIFMLQR